MANISFSIPENISNEIIISEFYENFNARGVVSSYGIDIELPVLNLHKNIKSKDLHVLPCKLESALVTWGKQFARHQETEHRQQRAEDVEELNDEAKEAIEELNGILEHTLDVDDTVDWEAIKRKEPFKIDPGEILPSVELRNLKFTKNGKPTGYTTSKASSEPDFERFNAGYGFFAKLFNGSSIKTEFAKKQAQWRKEVRDAEIENKKREDHLSQYKAAYNEKLKAFEDEKHLDNEALNELKKQYQASDPKAVEDYCDLVLSASEYPDYFPRNWVVEYRPESQLLIVELDLPVPEELPTVESYKYVKSRDEVTEKSLSAAAQKKLYDSVIYQICIRTLHEIFESDAATAIGAMAFNGVVTSRNKATGSMESKVILSVCADKEKFEAFDLANVDPKATFKHLKGVSAAALYDLAPIPPVIALDKTDKRFVEGKSVNVDSSVNLAAMHWEDFEHLVRELFEKEFASNGGEVRVTQASSDGGVDAVAFDPDPIRGGKIVIQAKRYTNVVGVAAVRDLYGTVMNEGATKGILVTTSDYGKDSYEFAKDKPLSLLNGNNLLSLLEQHGHQARINVQEAKAILGGL